MGTDSSGETTARQEQSATDSHPIREGTPEDMVLLDAGLVALQAERDRLRKQAEYRQLREEIANMTQAATGTPAAPPRDTSEMLEDLTRDTTDDSTSSITGSKRSSGGDLAIPIRRNLRPERLEFYRGKTLKEHREFFRRAENAFRLTPENFLSDNTKIVYAMQYLRGEPEEAWARHYDACNPHTISWSHFKTFLLNLVEDPVNRQLDATQQYQDAKQKQGQTVHAFETYLSELEAQLPVQYTEEQSHLHLFTRLRPELRTAITNYQNIPTTRYGLVALAARLEKNQTKPTQPRQERQEEKGRHKHPYKQRRRSDGKPLDKRERSREGSNERKPQGDRSNVICYKCNRKGHYAPDCRSKTKSDANRTPIASATKPGKGRASPASGTERRNEKS